MDYTKLFSVSVIQSGVDEMHVLMFIRLIQFAVKQICNIRQRTPLHRVL